MKNIDRRLTEAFSAYIRKRDPRCVVCGNAPTECAHLFAGRHNSTRWDTRCAFGLCHFCHMSQHQDQPDMLKNFFLDRYGQDAYDGLVRLNNTVVRLTDEQKKAILDEIKAD